MNVFNLIATATVLSLTTAVKLEGTGGQITEAAAIIYGGLGSHTFLGPGFYIEENDTIPEDR